MRWSPIANKYREGKLQRTLKRELKEPEIGNGEGFGHFATIVNSIAASDMTGLAEQHLCCLWGSDCRKQRFNFASRLKRIAVDKYGIGRVASDRKRSEVRKPVSVCWLRSAFAGGVFRVGRRCDGDTRILCLRRNVYPCSEVARRYFGLVKGPEPPVL